MWYFADAKKIIKTNYGEKMYTRYFAKKKLPVFLSPKKMKLEKCILDISRKKTLPVFFITKKNEKKSSDQKNFSQSEYFYRFLSIIVEFRLITNSTLLVLSVTLPSWTARFGVFFCWGLTDLTVVYVFYFVFSVLCLSFIVNYCSFFVFFTIFLFFVLYFVYCF